MVGVYRIGEEILVNTATTGAQHSQKIAALSDGSFVVTWVDYSQSDGGATGDSNEGEIKAQLFGPGGTPVGGELLVNTSISSSQFFPEITALANGGFVITWEDYSGTGEISGIGVKAQVFAADGSPVGEELVVPTATTDDQTAPQITALVDGGFVITWMDESASGYAVKAQVFKADGSKVGLELSVSSATAGHQEYPQISPLANGGFVITWTDGSPGNGGAGGGQQRERGQGPSVRRQRRTRRRRAAGQPGDCR